MADLKKLVCLCGFSTESPEAMVDHCLTTKHMELPDGIEDSGDLAEFITIFGVIQQAASAEAAGEDFELPEGMEISPVSEADILEDDDLPDEVKQELLARLAEIRKKHEGEQ